MGENEKVYLCENCWEIDREDVSEDTICRKCWWKVVVLEWWLAKSFIKKNEEMEYYYDKLIEARREIEDMKIKELEVKQLNKIIEEVLFLLRKWADNEIIEEVIENWLKRRDIDVKIFKFLKDK